MIAFNYYYEFKTFQMIDMFQSIMMTSLTHHFQSWNCEENSELICDLIILWNQLIQSFSNNSDILLHNLIRQIFCNAIETVIIPKIKQYMFTHWNPMEPNSCLEIIESIQSIIQINTFEDIIDNYLLPKLTTAISDWKIDSYSMDSWIVPWISVIDHKKLRSLYPEIRRKLSKIIEKSKYFNDYLLKLVIPWKPIFDATSYDNMIVRSIIPLLISKIRELELNAYKLNENNYQIFEWIMDWENYIPIIHFHSLIEGEFLPKWINALILYLQSNYNIENLFNWYLNWKNCLLINYSKQSLLIRKKPLQCIIKGINISLEIINEIIIKHTNINKIQNPYILGYFQLLEKETIKTHLKQQSNQFNDMKNRNYYSNSNSNLSLKQIVEEIALQNDKVFRPFQHNLHQDRLIYKYETKVISFIGDFIYELNKTNEWIVLGLEDLIK